MLVSNFYIGWTGDPVTYPEHPARQTFYCLQVTNLHDARILFRFEFICDDTTLVEIPGNTWGDYGRRFWITQDFGVGETSFAGVVVARRPAASSHVTRSRPPRRPAQ
jgi:hypothetical protein